ncbi:unnamed protein product [Prorocentrum cordatum]|uniref:Uncharacterized protein n=1 Tax=Prorocentrum cordatum TaxID=2364126 RepID=A0ABN9W2B2_9DINO|nr:unnamed protein product [Polarella glacialis]
MGPDPGPKAELRAVVAEREPLVAPERLLWEPRAEVAEALSPQRKFEKLRGPGGGSPLQLDLSPQQPLRLVEAPLAPADETAPSRGREETFFRGWPGSTALDSPPWQTVSALREGGGLWRGASAAGSARDASPLGALLAIEDAAPRWPGERADGYGPLCEGWAEGRARGHARKSWDFTSGLACFGSGG